MSYDDESDLGFEHTAVKNGTVLIRHKDKLATTLGGAKAIAFLKKMDALNFHEQQQCMARVTGHYKHGNERLSKRHYKNRA